MLIQSKKIGLYLMLFGYISFWWHLSSNWDFWPKSKTRHEVIWKVGAFLCIFIGDFIKNWGQVGALGFFWAQSWSKILAIYDMKKFLISKILFLVIKYLSIPYWSMIERFFIPPTCRARENFVCMVKKLYIKAQNMYELLRPWFWPQVQSWYG